MACQFDESPHAHESSHLPDGNVHRQLFSEVLVAEDIDLGSRVHTLGFKCALAAALL
jgi:hypothetical protein